MLLQKQGTSEIPKPFSICVSVRNERVIQKKAINYDKNYF